MVADMLCYRITDTQTEANRGISFLLFPVQIANTTLDQLEYLVMDADQKLVAMMADAVFRLVLTGEGYIAGGAEAAHEGPVRQPKHGALLV